MRSIPVLLFFVGLSLAAAAIVHGPTLPAADGQEPQQVARTMGNLTDPVAVISPMPDIISNGTFYLLVGNRSYDLDNDLVNRTNTIINHTWEITFGDEVTYLYGSIDQYWFWDQGLYKIKLTVTDIWGNQGVDFTAVISVDDSDFDDLPDWWEMAYFDTLDHGPGDDNDADGYSNLQEYADGTDPTVADPPPAGEGFVEENWEYMVIAAAAAAAVALGTYPLRRKRRKEREKKKIKYAIEIEKSLDED